ncbi:HAD-IA family hydrolase [Streptomyces sp. NPDC048404]|uniref:HAD family hydrolase n=1 Tax=unclassified Streptomyces TaxID=2593676 RepID=UPI00342D0AE1
MESEGLADLIEATRSVFLDFDGPVCEVFSGIPASKVAESLVGVMRGFNAQLAQKMEGLDFMDALRVSPRAGERALHAVEDCLVETEIAAVKVAGDPTPGCVASIEAARASGRDVVIVSNNSAECVREFLMRHDLTSHVQEIVGRPTYQPDRMKPSPYMLQIAASRLGVTLEGCTLVGDSVTDIEAAISAGSMSIGYANRAGKDISLAEAGADTVIRSMTVLADALKGGSPS